MKIVDEDLLLNLLTLDEVLSCDSLNASLYNEDSDEHFTVYDIIEQLQSAIEY